MTSPSPVPEPPAVMVIQVGSEETAVQATSPSGWTEMESQPPSVSKTMFS